MTNHQSRLSASSRRSFDSQNLLPFCSLIMKRLRKMRRTLNMMVYMQVAALLQEPYADLKPGGDVDAAQWREVASLPAMKGGHPSFVSIYFRGINIFYLQQCCFQICGSLKERMTFLSRRALVAWQKTGHHGILCDRDVSQCTIADLTKNSAKICMEAAKRFARALR